MAKKLSKKIAKIEKQAAELHEQATKDAKQLRKQAKKEARELQAEADAQIEELSAKAEKLRAKAVKKGYDLQETVVDELEDIDTEGGSGKKVPIVLGLATGAAAAAVVANKKRS
jgi:regulator of protease activity HflC (stomatin/prohibitin superfamily)